MKKQFLFACLAFINPLWASEGTRIEKRKRPIRRLIHYHLPGKVPCIISRGLFTKILENPLYHYKYTLGVADYMSHCNNRDEGAYDPCLTRALFAWHVAGRPKLTTQWEERWHERAHAIEQGNLERLKELDTKESIDKLFENMKQRYLNRLNIAGLKKSLCTSEYLDSLREARDYWHLVGKPAPTSLLEIELHDDMLKA
jgi:hypothetical protein